MIDMRANLLPAQLALSRWRPLAESHAIGTLVNLVLYPVNLVVLLQVFDHKSSSLK
ncbi:hypothetical protein [Serratia odorifera]|uniref:hypothetical protein n=1 Tax=Serratia odorifera TaxID=618 RepID=UPI001F5464F5|nr:hypothetical protein [Serratia odorifera]